MQIPFILFCSLLAREILYLDDKRRVVEVDFGDQDSGSEVPSYVRIVIADPEPATTGIEVADEILEPTSELPTGLSPDLSFDHDAVLTFDPTTFRGLLSGQNIIRVHSDSGEVYEFHVYHQVPVAIAIAYPEWGNQ